MKATVDAMHARPAATAGSFDIVVIGGGLVGLAIAFGAAQSGSRTALIERGPLGGEASGRSGGVVRQQGRKVAQLPLARQAVEHWRTLAHKLGQSAGFQQAGHVEVATTAAEQARQLMQMGDERVHGIDTRWMDGDELRRMIPGIGAGAIGGKYCAADGYAIPEIAICAFAAACRNAGVALMMNTPVTGLSRDGPRLAGVQTPDGNIEASMVVNAAGAWAPAIAQLADLYLPIYPTRGHLAVTVPVAGFSERVVATASHDFLAVPRADGSYLVGSKQPDATRYTYSKTVNPESMARLRRGIGRIAPALAHVPFAQQWAGTRECTPDAMPLIGPMPEFENFFVCAGFSGEGFALAPLVGDLLVTWLRSGQRPALLAGYEVERFWQGESPFEIRPQPGMPLSR